MKKEYALMITSGVIKYVFEYCHYDYEIPLTRLISVYALRYSHLAYLRRLGIQYIYLSPMRLTKRFHT